MSDLPPHDPRDRRDHEEPHDTGAPERPTPAGDPAGGAERAPAASGEDAGEASGRPTTASGPDAGDAHEQATAPMGQDADGGHAAAAGAGTSPRRLTRSADDRILAGVSSGLGRYFAVDPILFRLAFVLLTAAGGIGLVVYLAGWVLMPVEGRETTPRSRGWTLALAVLLVLLAAPLLDGPFFAVTGPILFIALLAGTGYVLWRAAGGTAPERPLVAAGIGLVVLAAALIGAGLVGFAAAALGVGSLLAATLLLCGLALVIGAFHGGARWLMLPAIVVALPLAFVAAADLEVDGPVGERYHRASTLTDVRQGYELGFGNMRVDLRQVDFPAGTTRVPIDVGLGNASVLVPDDVCIASELDFGIGHANVLGQEIAGVDLFEPARAVAATSAAAPVVLVDADVGIGNVEVYSDRDGFIDLPAGPSDRIFEDDTWDLDDHPQLRCDEDEL